MCDQLMQELRVACGSSGGTMQGCSARVEASEGEKVKSSCEDGGRGSKAGAQPQGCASSQVQEGRGVRGCGSSSGAVGDVGGVQQGSCSSQGEVQVGSMQGEGRGSHAQAGHAARGITGRDVLALLQAVRQAVGAGSEEEAQQDQAQGSSTAAAEASQVAGNTEGSPFVAQIQVPASWIQQALQVGQVEQQGPFQCQVQ